MDVTRTGRGVVTAPTWRISPTVPEQVAPSCLYDSEPWLRGWERVTVERRARTAYVHTDPDAPGARADDGVAVLPLYALHESPFWDGYERQVDLVGRFGDPVVFAGSPYSMYTRRGHVPAALIEGAHTTAMEWIAEGVGELLVVPNLTEEGVEDWLRVAGEPVGRLLLERTYATDLADDLDTQLHRTTNKIRRDVARRLRRADERGLTVRVVEGEEARALVPAVYPLTVDTSDKNDWPPLFDEASLTALLEIPGAFLLVAEVDGRLVGAFFAFRRGTEVTFMCGGVSYATLHDLSTYVALMYRGTEWAYANGVRRLEWGRDNYRFKERHALTGTDLYALVYAPGPRPDLVPELRRMHAELSAYIEGE
ncbi:GNAT family N-acetyltransferase [Streptomyces sp. NBC_01335]|uniref:GNAT family N-acetyltransferase n=1 Tax=Streptomyces sp. NBC_01335 TaxID=2903828 RepID=UPI002E0EA52F|nr:GNAT family N-acetyltransferase [Streptomyces sp. NBC_01335]